MSAVHASTVTKASTKIAARVASRALPATPPLTSVAAPGSGQLCEVCDERIFSSAIEIMCELPYRPTVRLHVPCYLAWVDHALHPPRLLANEAAPPKTVYLQGPISDLNLLDRYLVATESPLPFNVDAVRRALRHCPVSGDRPSDAVMGLPLPAAVAESFKTWLERDAQRLAEVGHQTMSTMLRRLSFGP